jgi:hypothetical protein
VGGSGGTSVIEHRRSLGGQGGYTVRARAGHTGCEASEWVSDSSLMCKIGQGAGGTRQGVVTAGERGGSATEAWSYDAAGGMSSVDGSNVGGSGGASATVHGRNLGSTVGYTVRARAGHTGCEASEWASDSAVRCKIGHGAGGTRQGVVTAGERGGSSTEAWSYDGAGGMSRVDGSNVAGSGGASVTVYGKNLGVKGGHTVRARAGHTGCEASEWVSDSAVRCKIGQGAWGTRQGVVTAGERGGSATEAWSHHAAGCLSRVGGSNVGGSGGASVTVHGRSLGGTGGYTVRARAGHTGCEASEWVSDSAVRCKIGHGAGGTRQGVVTAGERGGSATEAWSYDGAGDTNRVDESNVGGSGGASVTLHGMNLGATGGYTVRARAGHTGCEASEWVSDLALMCKIGQGAGGTRQGVVTAGERGGSATEAWSYDAAGGMSRVGGSNVGGSGGASVTVHGRSLGGKGGYTVRARAGHTGCEASEWVSDSAVRCKIGHGAGGTRQGVVTAGERGGSATEAWSYDAAGGMSRVDGSNVGGSGGASVTVHGRSLGGTVGHTVRARARHTGCEASEWVSDSAVRCKIGHGAGGTRQGVVTAGERGGSATEAWSYDRAGGMSRVGGSNVAGSGGASVTVHGRSLGGRGGYTVRARAGHTGCEASEWVSDSAVRCKIGQGAGGTRQGVVTAGERGGSATEAWSYDGAGGMSRVGGSNVGGSGGASVTVHGRSLGGTGGYTVRSRAGHTGCEASEWVSDLAVRCKIGQGAWGTRQGVVTAGERGGSATEAWSYDGAGGMSRVDGSNVGGSGGASVTVHGRSLGGKGGHTVRARAGHTGCEASEWVSDSVVRCKIGQGAGGSRQGVVTAGERGGSATEAWSYDGAGGMSRVDGSNVGGSGGASVTVHGRSLGGRGGYTVRARAGHTGCEASEWVSDSVVRCKIGQGAGGSRQGVVTAGEWGGSATEAWSYDGAGGMHLATGSNVGGSGGASVTVHGRNLGGKGGYTVRARAGHTGCEASEWVSDSAVRCKIGQGAWGTRQGLVTAGERGGSATEAWSYDGAGGMTRVGGSNVGGSGGASVTVHGRSLGGTGGYTVRARAGHTGCEASEWVSDSAVRCKIGQGIGGSRQGVVTAGERGGSATEACSYDRAGGMSRVGGSNVGGSGGASVTVYGRNLWSAADYTIRARAGHTGCEASEWVSDLAVRCKIGQGARGTRHRVGTVHQRGGSATEAWSYDRAGGMSRVGGSNVGGSGGASVTVHGRNLGGTGGYTVRARAGHTGCEASEWVSDSAVRCKIGHWAGGTRQGVVTAGERGGSATEAWSYDGAGGMSRVGGSNVGGSGGHR